MKIKLNAAAVLLALSALHTPALAQLPTQPTENLQSNVIKFDYLEPRSSEWKPAYERLKNRRVLERFSEFLSPFRLPVKFRMTTKECGQVNAFYDPGNTWSFQMCYEFVEDTFKAAPLKTTPDGLTRGEYIVGTFVGVVLHEFGHGLSDILKLPVLGREEDTADQISSYIMLLFGQDLARPALKGTYYNWIRNTRWDSSIYWDVHSTSEQRALNYLCIGYGANPQMFADFLQKKLLPEARAKNCAHEYQQVKAAFDATIMPYIDQDLLKKVQSTKWLEPQEFEDAR